jgi:hypothetical protein
MDPFEMNKQTTKRVILSVIPLLMIACGSHMIMAVSYPGLA